MSPIVDHVMIRVEALEDAIDWYQSHLKYEEKGRWEADTFTNVFLGPRHNHPDCALLELTYNHDGRTYEMGDSWGHIAVRVDDVYDAYERLVADGVDDYRDPDSCGGQYAFVKDIDGHEIEIVQRDDAIDWSIDHVMIRVEHPDEAIGWYTRKLEHTLTRRMEADSFSLYFMKPPGTTEAATAVELTYNHDDRSYTIGNAWGHLAVRTDDLHGFWDLLMKRGAIEYRDPTSCNDRYAFTKDSDGHEIEIVRND